MKGLPLQKSTLALLAIIIPLLALFIYVALRSGPLAPVPVTLATVENKSIAQELFGIGTVEARYMYKIGPTFAGRIQVLDVHVGDKVTAGQLLGRMDPVDLNEHIKAQDAALKRAQAQSDEAEARHTFARNQMQRYQQLLTGQSVSEELVATRRQELQIAEAGLQAAQEELARIRAEREALVAQEGNLQLISPVNGLVASRNAEPGTTIVAGQAVVELIDPDSLWLNVRFDQLKAQGLAPKLPGRITLRSQAGAAQTGQVLRLEPVADAITEEILAKVVFDQLPEPLPSIGELAEVTIVLPTLAPGPVLPNAAIKRINGSLGVWQVKDGALFFTAVTIGPGDLNGQVQVLEGLKVGDQVVVYSAKTLHQRSRIDVVDKLPGVKK